MKWTCKTQLPSTWDDYFNTRTHIECDQIGMIAHLSHLISIHALT